LEDRKDRAFSRRPVRASSKKYNAESGRAKRGGGGGKPKAQAETLRRVNDKKGQRHGKQRRLGGGTLYNVLGSLGQSNEGLQGVERKKGGGGGEKTN